MGKISLVLRINSTRFTVNCPMTVNFREGENHCLGTILSDVKPQNWKGTGSSVKIELARRFSLIFLCWSNMSNLDFETWNAIETMINHPWFFDSFLNIEITIHKTRGNVVWGCLCFFSRLHYCHGPHTRQSP